MNGWTKEVAINIIKNSLTNIQKCHEEFNGAAVAIEKETLEFLEGLIEQIPNAISGPLIPKTPKVPRKRDIKRIQTIPENDVVENSESKDSNIILEDVTVGEKTCDDVPSGRTRRAASQKAAESIKVQQSLGIGFKLRRPSTIDDDAGTSQVKAAAPPPPPLLPPPRSSRAKRTKSVADSSDDDEIRRPAKYSKIKQKSVDADDDDETPVISKVKSENETCTLQDTSRSDITENNSSKRGSRNKRQREKSDGKQSRKNSRSSGKIWQQPLAKRANIADETIDIPVTDTTVEASLYEDAIGKSIPMNSTMNPNTSVTFDRKMMNVTVVLESMKFPMRMNETVTINKGKSNESFEGNATIVNEELPNAPGTVVPGSPRATTSVLQSKIDLQYKIKALKETLANPEFDALITEDESSPEKTIDEKNNKKRDKFKNAQIKETKRFTRSSIMSEDDVFEVTRTPPPKSVVRDVNGLKALKNSYKPNALFSPYSKESVKKRVEAFEQAGLNSPKTVEIDAPARLTRTKTRAMAAAAADTNYTQIGQTVAQKAARKSLAKAKEIAKMKERKENEESKENNVVNSAQKPYRLIVTNEKFAQKQQQRTTPIGKTRIQMPLSVNRIQHTPAASQLVNQKKALTASRTNIITSVDSFIQPPKTLTKSTSNDNLAEKRKKINDEDVRRKRDEAMKAISEEKRRKREERELKNKLAKEAKEKLDMEKRLKQEREREEKAKIALLLQERQREESERKKLLQLQRAQEKEERRRQEEQLKLLRLQEQEEAERQLAEQKRREQEAERRKIAEARAQQAAAAEAARLKAHYIAKAKNANKQQPDPTSYVLDSEPDDDESDDESKPKHIIPYWAHPSVRATQLAIQQYIPASAVLSFFGAKRCTPDLTDLFKGIKKERLQRTSSAIWKTPPRYSMMMNDQ